ncbi:MAG: chromosomal replication initiator protein DnaA [Oscillospiraceae bacterium]|nr:chromosomal replication initiator protein DnaA [Oscillospiraceae bacterium]
MNSAAAVWAKVLTLLEKDMTSTTIKTWFADVRAVLMEERRFILCCPDPLNRSVICQRYLGAVQAALKELLSADFEVVVVGEDEVSLYLTPPEERSWIPGGTDYTFENFVVGSSNKFAHAAALQVAEAPGKSYNPLFLYGESGLGKTHLLYAIAHTVRQRQPNSRVVYIKGDTFTNELIAAIREGKNQQFREKYRRVDVFLMDDVQFIAGRDSTQEEMFHTFNTLYEDRKQIVFTSDRPPKEMTRLEDRLKTRFEWGLLVDIQPPDYETRMAIIKNKALRMGVVLPEAVLQYIAENITSNIRQIEGTINKIMALQAMSGEEIDTATVVRAVRDMYREKSDFVPSSDLIIQEVCKFYTVEEAALRGKSRVKNTTVARQVAMYLIRNMTNMSLTEIGRLFDNRDHTTALHAINMIEKRMKDDSSLTEIVKDIKANINAHLE